MRWSILIAFAKQLNRFQDDKYKRSVNYSTNIYVSVYIKGWTTPTTHQRVDKGRIFKPRCSIDGATKDFLEGVEAL